MHPTLRYDLMQARQHDQLREAAQHRLVAQAKTARPARGGNTAAAPHKRALRLVFRLRPA